MCCFGLQDIRSAVYINVYVKFYFVSVCLLMSSVLEAMLLLRGSLARRINFGRG